MAAMRRASQNLLRNSARREPAFRMTATFLKASSTPKCSAIPGTFENPSLGPRAAVVESHGDDFVDVPQHRHEGPELVTAFNNTIETVVEPFKEVSPTQLHV